MGLCGWMATLAFVGLCSGCEQSGSEGNGPAATTTNDETAGDASGSSTLERPPVVASSRVVVVPPTAPANSSGVRPVAAPTASPSSAGARSAWCGEVTVPALTQVERQALIEKFQQRNPGAPSGGAESGPYIGSAGHFIAASGMIQPSPGSGGAPASATAAEQQAVELVRKNADLLGFTVKELEHAKLSAREGPSDTLLSWSVRFSGTAPRSGYESFATVAKNIRITVSIQQTGAMSIANASEVLPAFRLCTAAPLSPKSPAVVKEVIGKALSYHSYVGALVSPGAIEPRDIGTIEKTIHVAYSNTAPRDATLTLAYAVRVTKGGMPWTAFVDARSGRLITIQQNFRT